MKAEKRGRPKQVASGVSPFEETVGDEDADKIYLSGEGQFDLALADAPIGVAIVGLDSRLLRANRALCEMLGYSQRELLERNLPDLTHPDDRWKDKALTG